jgi:hypothetical protein
VTACRPQHCYVSLHASTRGHAACRAFGSRFVHLPGGAFRVFFLWSAVREGLVDLISEKEVKMRDRIGG